MSLQQNNTLVIKLLGREYKIKCPADRMSELQESAHLVEQKIRELSIDTRRNNPDLPILVALNLASELLSQKKQKHNYLDNMQERILQLKNRIESALEQAETIS